MRKGRKGLLINCYTNFLYLIKCSTIIITIFLKKKKKKKKIIKKEEELTQQLRK